MGLIPLLICFLGATKGAVTKGIAATCIGTLILLRPPSYRLPWAVIVAWLAVIVLPLAAFLPADWIKPAMEWRQFLARDWGIHLASSCTPQPWVTFESWLLLVLGACWLAWCGSRGTSLEDRRLVLRLIALGAVVLSVLTLLDHAKVLKVPWWNFTQESGETFGPFPNRNHTSSLFAIASVLCAALAYDCYRERNRLWLLFVLCLGPCFVAIISNTSRAGIVLFFVGITLWIWSAAMRKGFFKKLALASALVLGGVSVALVFGGQLSERLTNGSGAPFESSARLNLYQDAISMTAQSPWTGIGLGNFSDVYPQFASFPYWMVRFYHPESDWFWVMCEGGMPLAIACVALLGLFASLAGPWGGQRSQESASRQDRRLRNAAGIGAAIAAVHGIVDVPNHGVAYGLVATLLLGLAVKPSRVQTPATLVGKSLFCLAGGLVLAAGVCWLLIGSGRPVMPGFSSARLLLQQAAALSHANRDAEALKLTDQAIRMNPLEWRAYFFRAQLHLRLGRPDQVALTDFGRARAVEPHYAGMCFDEGDIWLAYNPILAVQAWNELMRRDPGRIDYYQVFLGRMPNTPEMRAEARKLARTPALKFIYLQHAYQPEDFTAMLDAMLASEPTLGGLDSKSRLELFRMWQARGNREELKQRLETNLAWQADGWPVLADERAKLGDFEGAYKLAVHYVSPPIVPAMSGVADVGRLEQNFLFNPTDPLRAMDLYFAYKNRNELDAAFATLEKIARQPNAPAYVTYEMASVHAQKQDFRKAWELMSVFLANRK